MRTVWNIVSVIAVANLLALAGFVGWLGTTDRLSVERVRELRAAVGKTITQQQSEAEAATAKAEENRRVAEEAIKAARPPLTAAERLAARIEATELDQQKAERLKREVEDLQRRLADERRQIDQDRVKLDADRAAFDQMVAANQGTLNDAQFLKTLGVLQTVKPPQAVAMLKEILTGGAAPVPFSDQPAADAAAAPLAAQDVGRLKQVVAYLDAMDERPRNKLMAEFAKNDPRLAAELLEQLRKRADFARPEAVLQ